ncbi:transketolase [bacterium]|nr:transketolase [bacterium]
MDNRSIKLRKSIVHMLEHSRRGHVGSAFSLVEILRVLYDEVLTFDPRRPTWHKRDRFLLSKGHGCLALYVLLAEKGFFPADELTKFCHADGILGGHPDHKVPGIEASTGSLGHGLSIAIGMALNERLDRLNYRTFVVLGDGESNEGSVWEAALCAAKHKLENLTVLIDYNKMQSYGPTSEIQDLEPLPAKWQSFGFGTVEVDGHHMQDLRNVFGSLPLQSGRPSAIVCHTIKGKGIDFTENNLDWHHKSRMTDAEVTSLFESLERASCEKPA